MTFLFKSVCYDDFLSTCKKRKKSVWLWLKCPYSVFFKVKFCFVRNFSKITEPLYKIKKFLLSKIIKFKKIIAALAFYILVKIPFNRKFLSFVNYIFFFIGHN